MLNKISTAVWLVYVTSSVQKYVQRSFAQAAYSSLNVLRLFHQPQKHVRSQNLCLEETALF